MSTPQSRFVALRTRAGLLGLALVFLALVVLGGLLLMRVRHVRSDLAAAQARLPQVEQQLRAGDAPDLHPLQAQLAAARSQAGGWLWRAAEVVPVAGGDLRTARRASAVLDDLSRHALPPLATAAHDALQGHLVSHGQVDLAALAQVQAAVDQAAPSVHAAERTVHGLHSRFFHHQLRQLQDKVARLDSALSEAHDVLAQAPALLGASGDRRYLLAVQNNAEARATGGLIGAIGELDVHAGRLTLARTLTTEELHNAPTDVPGDPAAARTWVAIGSTLAFFDANLTPHVPDAARNVAGLWQAQTGQHVDGVFFVDAVSLQLLTRAPVTLTGGRVITPDQVTDFICKQEYVDYPDTVARKDVLRALAATVFHDATSGGPGAGTALRAAASSGHLFAWFADPADQALVHGHPLEGALPSDGRAYLQVLTQNFAGDKLDYYVHRTVQVRREGSALRVTVTLTNDVPAGLPPYIWTRSDNPQPPVPYGQDLLALSLYGGKGATFDQPTLNGQPLDGLQTDVDHGLGFATAQVEVPPGRTTVVSVLLHGPPGVLTYVPQPLAHPDVLDLGVHHRITRNG